jgi:hypothetical protein
MVKMHSTGLADYEMEDPLWWCQHHKSTLGLLALRLEQVLDGRADLDPMCRILIKNVKEKNGIDWTYYDEERPSSGRDKENDDSEAC